MQEKAGKAGVVSLYTEVYCDCGAKARLDCIAIQCPAKPRYGQGAQPAGAEARRARGRHMEMVQAHGAGAHGALGCAAGGRAGRERVGTGARSERASCRRASASILAWRSKYAAGARQGRAGCSRGARPGLLLGQQAVHSVY